MITVIIVTGTTVHALVAQTSGCLCSHAVTGLEHGYTLADLKNDTGKFVAKDHGEDD